MTSSASPEPATLSVPPGHRVGALLEGRVAVISGAGRERGIGKATAKLFAAHGASVALLDLDETEVYAAAADIAATGANAIGLVCDVSNPDSCKAAIARVQAWSTSRGRIDILVNNAGLTQRKRVADISVEDYSRITDVVLAGTLRLSQAVMPAMRSQRAGSIICISSMSAQQGGGVFGGAHYCAAKAGVLGLVRAMARELGADGVRANAITPGLILTDFSRSGATDESKQAIAKDWPLARAGDPAEIAGACLFLASDLSSYVTGVTLDVNGGAYMR
jgi:NAD(P)-dependent dehydrogenase (short-subunit alcohol dehydrogenase family)